MSVRLLQRLRALSVMAERGTKYERRNAKLLLAKLLKKHGLTEADLHFQGGTDWKRKQQEYRDEMRNRKVRFDEELKRKQYEQEQRVYQRRAEDRRRAEQRQQAKQSPPPPPRPAPSPPRHAPLRQRPAPPPPRPRPAQPHPVPPQAQTFESYLNERPYIVLFFAAVLTTTLFGLIVMFYYEFTGEMLLYLYR